MWLIFIFYFFYFLFFWIFKMYMAWLWALLPLAFWRLYLLLFCPSYISFYEPSFFFFGKNPECNFIWGPIWRLNLQYFFGFDWKQKMSFLTLFLHLWATKSLVKIAVTNLKKKKKKKKGDYKKCDFHWQPLFFGFLFSSDFIFRPVTLQFRTLSVNGIMVAIK